MTESNEGGEAGAPGSESPSDSDRPGEGRPSSRWAVLVPAFVGGAVTLVLVVVPFAPVFGGAVAGYLRNGTRREGAAVGGFSGLLATLPVGLFGPLVLAVAAPGPIPHRASFAALVVALLVLFLAVVYFVGGGAAGGVVGVVVRERNR